MEETKTDLDRTENGLRGKKEAKDILKKELQSLVDLDKYEEQIRTCLVKLEWIQVYAIDDIIDQLQKENDTKEDDLNNAKNAVINAENNFDGGGDMETIKEKLSEIQEDLGIVVNDVENKKKLVKLKNAECSEVQRDMRLITMNMAENNSHLSSTRLEVSGTLSAILSVLLSMFSSSIY